MSIIHPPLDPALCVKVASYDDANWIVTEPYRYVTRSVRHGTVIVVPAGFITDGASVPRYFWRVIPPFGRHFNAAVVHDWLYRNQPHLLTKDEADMVLLEIMEHDGVPGGRQRAMFLAVREFGQKSYEEGKLVAQAEVPASALSHLGTQEVPL